MRLFFPSLKTFRYGITSVTLLLLALGSPLFGQQSDPMKVKISLTASDKAKFLHFTEGKTLTDKFSYRSADLDSAPVLDSVLIGKALQLGGLNFTFEFVEVPNSERERNMVKDGEVVVAGTSQWDFWTEENQDKVYKSDVVVPNGSFEKGLYTTKERLAKLSVKGVKDLAAISCASSSNWRVDWKTLQGLHFLKLDDSATRTTMFKLVGAGRIDTTLQSFSGTPDMSIVDTGITLVPIPGVKVLLNGARHYVVSKVNPDGAKVFEALQKGLALMKKDNEINRALTETGFFNPNVKSWATLQAP